MVISYKKLIVSFLLVFVLFSGILATKPPQKQKPVYSNLKVLSKNISDEKLDLVMESFNIQLGVNCMFCHIHKEKGYEFTFDYASDSMMNKRIARDMLRMTFKLNKKYFNIKLTGNMSIPGKITCLTCHKGKPVPLFTSYRK
ncbi:MAG: c-type cytochrome [Bacteroidota bacterium]|nr:c-type cytochrome [Bacteroidota bacterium]